MPTESTRKKSCASCRVAKTRCNLAVPYCARCEIRKLECTYERKIHAGPAFRSKDLDQTIEINTDSGSGIVLSCTAKSPLGPSSARPAGAVTEHADNLQDTAPQIPERIAPDTRLGQSIDASLDNELGFDWDFDIDPWLPARSMDLDEHTPTILEDLNPVSQHQAGAKDIGTSHFPSRRPQIADSNPLTIDMDSQTREHENLLPSPMQWYHLSPEGRALVQNSNRLLMNLSVQMTARIFLPRTFATSAASLTATYLKAVLSSYPKLMIQNSALPPYFHPCFPKSVSDNCLCYKGKTSLPESLAICSSIVHMSLTKTHESHAFLWSTIRIEQERLYSKIEEYDQWELLSALQAMSIYIILRITESHPVDAAVDLPLVVTMADLANRLYRQGGYLCEKEQQGKIPVWRDWIFMESKRRIFTVLFALDMLYSVNIKKVEPADCEGQNNVPLTCSRKLWEAKSASVWREIYTVYLDNRKGSTYRTYGDLKQSRQSHEREVSDPRLEDDVGEWCKDLDGLGLLTFNAALIP